MNTGSYVFAQMVKFLDEFVFLRIVKKYDGDKYVKHFSCWNQLLTLMFGQLTGKPSLRRFIIASAPIQKKFYSLGMGRNVTRSNLSKANNTRDYRIFEEFAYHTVGVAQKMRIENDLTPLQYDSFAEAMWKFTRKYAHIPTKKKV